MKPGNALFNSVPTSRLARRITRPGPLGPPWRPLTCPQGWSVTAPRLLLLTRRLYLPSTPVV